MWHDETVFHVLACSIAWLTKHGLFSFRQCWMVDFSMTEVPERYASQTVWKVMALHMASVQCAMTLAFLGFGSCEDLQTDTAQHLRTPQWCPRILHPRITGNRSETLTFFGL